MFRLFTFTSLLHVGVFTCGSLVAYAQSGQLSGTILDTAQALVVGSNVTLIELGSNVVTRTTTGPTGQYTFVSLKTGTYRLEVRKAGFATATIGALTISDGSTIVRDLTLSVENASSSVNVVGRVSGTPSAGYYVDNVDRGVLGNAPIVNQPYTITVLPTEELANTQVKTVVARF